MKRVILPPLAAACLLCACSTEPVSAPAPGADTAPAAVAAPPAPPQERSALPASPSDTPPPAVAETSVAADAPAAEPAPLIPSSGTPLATASLPEAPPSTLPRPRTPEELLRTEALAWRRVPYKDNGTTRRGISNAGFVRAVYRNALEKDIPAVYDQQLRTGKLVERANLAPGDLVFFEGKGVGPFRSHWVGLYLGSNQVALAEKSRGVAIQPLTGSEWGERFRTARRIPLDTSDAPTFDATAYGSTEELLREVAKAWSGTLYKQGGTSFDGIGNDEFIRNIYEAIYDTELEGEQKQWAIMGSAVRRAQLEAGDIILYEGGGLGNPRHAGMYIGDGEFVHAMRGSAVTISRLKDARWQKAYVAARRIDPDELARVAQRRAGNRPSEPPAGVAADLSTPAPVSAAPATMARDMSDIERQLREATEPWKGTPYKLGGTTRAGIDCSALVQLLYRDVFEMELPRTALEQERLGSRVDRRGLAAGDLVFFRTQGMGPFFKSRHVGLYLGNGEFAQASGRLGVNIARLDNYYWNRKFVGARRLTAR